MAPPPPASMPLTQRLMAVAQTLQCMFRDALTRTRTARHALLG